MIEQRRRRLRIRVTRLGASAADRAPNRVDARGNEGSNPPSSTGESLANLTADDLIGLGVTSIDHRGHRLGLAPTYTLARRFLARKNHCLGLRLAVALQCGFLLSCQVIEGVGECVGVASDVQQYGTTVSVDYY
jgi:hypothetical protein